MSAGAVYNPRVRLIDQALSIDDVYMRLAY
jgi:hypothetical protein